MYSFSGNSYRIHLWKYFILKHVIFTNIRTLNLLFVRPGNRTYLKPSMWLEKMMLSLNAHTGLHKYYYIHIITNPLILQGGFAKCYEIQDKASNHVYAGKIVSKKLMVKSSQKEKMAQEISIHRSLDHKHVVGFHSFFEDSLNIYIILELCKRRVRAITRSI